jgi:hypothetical protein
MFNDTIARDIGETVESEVLPVVFLPWLYFERELEAEKLMSVWDVKEGTVMHEENRSRGREGSIDV